MVDSWAFSRGGCLRLVVVTAALRVVDVQGFRVLLDVHGRQVVVVRWGFTTVRLVVVAAGALGGDCKLYCGLTGANSPGR